MTDAATNQSHFWQVSRDNQTYTELCNALYERELLRLSQLSTEQLLRLPNRLASLPFYIRRAASNIVQQRSELQLDSQNASWYSKQAGSCPARKQQAAPIDTFYQKYAKPGLIVPLYITRLTHEQIVLDSVDEVDVEGLRLHCNEHGWFAMAGWPQEPDNQQKLLLKPSKTVFVAVCCGHQWRNQERKLPRLLSLREMLLASRLNWQNFAKPFQP